MIGADFYFEPQPDGTSKLRGKRYGVNKWFTEEELNNLRKHNRFAIYPESFDGVFYNGWVNERGHVVPFTLNEYTAYKIALALKKCGDNAKSIETLKSKQSGKVGLTQHIIDTTYKSVNETDPITKLVDYFNQEYSRFGRFTEDNFLLFDLKESYHSWYEIGNEDVASIVRVDKEDWNDDIALNYRDIRPIIFRIMDLTLYTDTLGTDHITEVANYVRVFRKEYLKKFRQDDLNINREVVIIHLLSDVLNLLYLKYFGDDSTLEREIEKVVPSFTSYFGYNPTRNNEPFLSEEVARTIITKWLNLPLSNRVRGLLSSKFEQNKLQGKLDQLEAKYDNLQRELEELKRERE